MERKPLESDWKTFSKRVPEWRERYLLKKNEEIIGILTDNSKTPTERFWNAKKRMKEEANILVDCLALMTAGSELKEAVKEPRNPRLGVLIHSIIHGKSPLTRNTAMSMPQKRNHFFPFSVIVESTSALIIALSMLMIISNNASPETISIKENQSIFQ